MPQQKLHKHAMYALLAVIVMTSGPAVAEELILADFETKEDIARWRAGVKNDHRGPKVTWSQDHATHGKGCMRVHFTRHQPGLAAWALLVGDIDNKAFTITDWSDYDTLTMDIYNPHPEKRKLRITIFDFEGRFVKPRAYFPPGLTRVRFSIDEMAREGLKTHFMNTIRFVRRTPPIDAIFYIDNIRLEKLTSARLESVTEQIDILDRLAGLLAPAEGDSLREQLRSLRKRLASAKADPSSAKAIQQDATNLVDRYRPLLLKKLFLTGSKLFPARPETMTLDLIREGAEPATAFRLADPHRLAEKATRFARQASLEHRLAEISPGPLAIGVYNAPQPEELIYRPRIYDGPLKGRVELDAAGNEVEAACLMLLPNSRDLQNVRWSAGDLLLQNNTEATIPAENVRIQPLGYRRSRPDEPARAWILRPDIDRIDIPEDAQHALWLTVRVPRDARPGEYEGTVTVTADGIEPVQVPIHLNVRPFALPETIRMPVVCAYNVSPQADRLVAEHRVNAGRIYQWPSPPSIETIQRRVKLGTTMNNLLRISRMGRNKFKRGEDGKLHVSKKWKKAFFRKLDRIVPELKKQGLLKYCYVYGFDEAPFGEIPAMEEIYGEIRQRYGLDTMFCALLPLWEQYPAIKNVTHYSVVHRNLSPEVVTLIRKAGSKVWTHNQRDSFPQSRTQFWSAYRLGLDGLMHYGLRSGGWVTDPEQFPIEDGPIGGMVLRVKGGGDEITGYATLAFEQWRDGSEDVEYFVKLQKLCDMLDAHARSPEDCRTLAHARYWASVPKDLAPPIWGRSQPQNPPTTARQIASARLHWAELIEQLQAISENVFTTDAGNVSINARQNVHE